MKPIQVKKVEKAGEGEKPLHVCSVCKRLTTLFFGYDTGEEICPDCQAELNPTTIHWTA